MSVLLKVLSAPPKYFQNNEIKEAVTDGTRYIAGVLPQFMSVGRGGSKSKYILVINFCSQARGH
jgi:hypothetical protein